jgi:uracil-DNA glycosylase family 4
MALMDSVYPHARLRNEGCALCPLHRDALTICMMGVGPAQARVMIVSDAPGANEDAGGEPFVGQSGRLLMKALDELCDLTRADVYITNVCKCRPDENRTPHAKEVKACAETYLDDEILAVKPEFVLAFGNVPLKALTKKSGITKYSGQEIERTVYSADRKRKHTFKVFPSLHPAAVLRNPGYARTFASDMERFGRVLRGERTGLVTTSHIVTSQSELRKLRDTLMRAKVIAWDVETYRYPAKDAKYKRNALQEWGGDDSQIVSVSFTVKEGESFVVPLYHPEVFLGADFDFIAFVDDVKAGYNDLLGTRAKRVLQYLKPALERDDAVYVAHNGKFDCKWMAAKGARVPQSHDTLVLAHVIDENRGKGLKELSKTILGADAYDVGEELKNPLSMTLDALCAYNGKDTDYTFRLLFRFLKQLKAKPENYHRIYKLVMWASRSLLEIEEHGVYLDMERLHALRAQAEFKREGLRRWIQRQAEPFGMENMNPGSTQQLGKLLFEHMGIEPLEYTDTGAPGTRESVMLHLAREHKVALAIVKWRKLNKVITTYLQPWEYEHSDTASQRLMAGYRPTGTATGRLSGTQGIQQVPRAKSVRSLIAAPPGWSLVSMDYSQLELRIAAWVARERTMLDLFREGVDMHTRTGLQILQLDRVDAVLADVTKDDRSLAKPVNFGFLYSMGHRKFVSYAFDNYGIVVEEERAEELRNAYFELFPDLLRYHARQRAAVRTYGQVESPFGRVRHLPDIYSADEKIQASAERQAINSPVQSAGSDIMVTALCRMQSTFDAYTDEIKVVGTVHDSVLLEVRDEKLDVYLPEAHGIMEDMDYMERKFKCGKIPVPIIADVEVGTHWGEGIEWHPAS